MRSALLTVALTAAFTACNAQQPPRPHLLFWLIDDWGWANFGLHRQQWPSNEVVTPNLDALATTEGALLDQHYVFKYCSPSRCALQTGRNPIHVNVVNSPVTQHNEQVDADGGFQGVPRNMTGLAAKLQRVGYTTHQVGKWNAGLATQDHTPAGRGYQTSLSYADYDTWFWNETTTRSCPYNSTTSSSGGKVQQLGVVDLWDTMAPAARGVNNSFACSQSNQAAGCVYQDDLFVARVEDIIANYSSHHGDAASQAAEPLFLFWAPHAPHDPYEAPQYYLNKFSFINDTRRRYYNAMVNMLDDHVGNVTAALKAAGLWDNTLIVVSSDNGGPAGGSYGGNNWPLRGCKATNWQGGIRANAFMTGGFLPPALKGTTQQGFIEIADWYATFCALAGCDGTVDERAAAAGLPPPDSVNQWPLLSGANSTNPRRFIMLGHSTNPMITDNGNTTIQGAIDTSNGYKLLIGNVSGSAWQGPTFPNASAYNTLTIECGDPAIPAGHPGHGPGCLFNVLSDPTEQNDVAAQYPAIVSSLRAAITEQMRTVYSPARGGDDGLACAVALQQYGGFWGPFIQ